jgi:hypothetical protein
MHVIMQDASPQDNMAGNGMVLVPQRSRSHQIVGLAMRSNHSLTDLLTDAPVAPTQCPARTLGRHRAGSHREL